MAITSGKICGKIGCCLTYILYYYCRANCSQCYYLLQPLWACRNVYLFIISFLIILNWNTGSHLRKYAIFPMCTVDRLLVSHFKKKIHCFSDNSENTLISTTWCNTYNLCVQTAETFTTVVRHKQWFSCGMKWLN